MKRKLQRLCARCGQAITSWGGRKYCGSCSDVVMEENERRRVRDRRTHKVDNRKDMCYNEEPPPG